MPANFGFKRVGGGGLNGKILRWEDRGGGVYRAHMYPGVAVATRIVSLPFGESYTEYHNWYSSGNVVSFPEPYSPFGAYGNDTNNVLCGGTSMFRARRGDTFHPQGLPGASGVWFNIVRAEAGAGDNFSTYTSDTWVQGGELGPIIRTDDVSNGGESAIVITDVETNYTGSTPGDWQSLGPSVVREILNQYRPYIDTADPYDISGARVDFDRAIVEDGDPVDIYAAYNGDVGNGYRTVLVSDTPHGLTVGRVIEITGSSTTPSIDGRQRVYSVVNETTVLLEVTGLSGGGTAGSFMAIGVNALVVTGSQSLVMNHVFVGVLSISSGALALAVLGELVPSVRISMTVDGEAIDPRIMTVRSPMMQLQPPEGVSTVYVQRLDRQTREWVPMAYAGASVNPYDPFTGYGVNEFKFNEDAFQLYFHPLLAGDTVQCTYKLAEPVGMTGYGEPGIFLRTWQYPMVDRTQYKRCDIIDVEDDGGILERAGNLANLECYIGSHGVSR